LLPPGAVRAHRAELDGLVPALEPEVEERQDRLDALIEAPRFEPSWQWQVRATYRELLALSGSASPAVIAAGDRLSRLYQDRIAASRDDGRFDEALAMLDGAESLGLMEDTLVIDAGVSVESGAPFLRIRKIDLGVDEGFQNPGDLLSRGLALPNGREGGSKGGIVTVLDRPVDFPERIAGELFPPFEGWHFR